MANDFDIQFDAAEFVEAADRLGAAADQMPFILSLALNRAVRDTRKYLTDVTWPVSITQRNPGFIKAALQTVWSNKQNLSVEIYDALGRASLKAHAEGGTKVPHSGSLAIPTSHIHRTAHGVPSHQKPRALRNSFRRGDKLYQQIGRGRSRRLRVMYLLKPSVRIPADVPFYADFAREMRNGLNRHLPGAVEQAMRTRR